MKSLKNLRIAIAERLYVFRFGNGKTDISPLEIVRIWEGIWIEVDNMTDEIVIDRAGRMTDADADARTLSFEQRQTGRTASPESVSELREVIETEYYLGGAVHANDLPEIGKLVARLRTNTCGQGLFAWDPSPGNRG